MTCTYEIKDNNEIQIINYKSDNYVNEEIESKIKIWNNGKKENLIFKKKFNKLGINSIDFIIEDKIKNMSYMFYKCSSLKEITFISFETAQATKMRAMFVDCKELEYLELSIFNTSNVTDMGFMFNGCNKLKEIKGINTFNTIKASNMYAMFEGCNELEYLDLYNFNTSNATDMGFMFNGCNKLKEIKGITNFNTKNATNMETMFGG